MVAPRKYPEELGERSVRLTLDARQPVTGSEAHPEAVAVTAVVRFREGRHLGSGKETAVLADRDETGV